MKYPVQFDSRALALLKEIEDADMVLSVDSNAFYLLDNTNESREWLMGEFFKQINEIQVEVIEVIASMHNAETEGGTN